MAYKVISVKHMPLLPMACPFCGSRVCLTFPAQAKAVVCRCGATGPTRSTSVAAIACWNRRADATPAPIPYTLTSKAVR